MNTLALGAAMLFLCVDALALAIALYLWPKQLCGEERNAHWHLWFTSLFFYGIAFLAWC